MKITYNPPRDTLRILFSNAPICETSCQGDVTLDCDQHGRLVGLELATASQHVSNPYSVDVLTDAAPEEGAAL